MLLNFIDGTSQSVESLNMLIGPSSTSLWQASTTKNIQSITLESNSDNIFYTQCVSLEE